MAFDLSLLILLAIGLVAGVASGLFGIGGGILIVPALVALAHFSQHKATGTSLAILLPPVGLAAVVAYYRRDQVDLRAALVVAVGVFVGGWIGAQLAGRLGGAQLRLLFGLFVTAVGGSLIWSAVQALRPR
ncbi:MAG: sulfite exporter TauE/SafE family protein [Gemmatimonadaceae bacterium]|jgi:hypothetical protein|nr:sulfite exporter TauE/SafE family protein [Gemmatimonadaceae bacterium]